MGKKSGPQVPVVSYSMSMHYGVSIAADALTGLYAEQQTVWEGNVSDNCIVDINNPSLFGGPKAQGGMVGQCYALFGALTQLAPAALAARLGLTVSTCPAFRGLFTLFFCKDAGGGFDFQYNSPNIPPVSVKLMRAPKAPALDPDLAMIPAQGAAADRLVSAGFNDNLIDPTTGLAIVIIGTGPTYGPTIPDANPAHIIYELLTNPDWGMGTDPSMIDTATFNESANILFGENLGLSIIWTSQDTIDALVTQILATINGALYVRPSTGKFELKLFRFGFFGDETDGASHVPSFNMENSVITSFSRKMPGELPNEVVVDWTNPLTEQTESITVQDPGAIANQNGIISQRSSYPAVRNEILAARLGARDLRSVGAPLAVIEATVDRVFWDLTPGAIVVVVYPEYGIGNINFRVIKIDYGKPGDAALKVNLIEDVFGLDYGQFIVAPTTKWTDPKKEPAPVALALPFTLPMFLLLNLGDGGAAASRDSPEVTVGMLAAPPVTSAGSFELYGEVTDGLGNVTDTDLGTRGFQSHGVSSTDLPRAVANAGFTVGTLIGFSTVPVGGFIVFGLTDETMEIACVSAYNSVSGAAVLERGLFDTVPQSWGAGTPFFLANQPTRIDDPTGRAAGDVLDYKLLTMAGLGRLDPAFAPIVAFTPSLRPFLPNRPGNVEVGGSVFDPINWTSGSDIPISWSNRNRLTEDARIVLWDDADLPGESGQTTTVKLWPDDLSAPFFTEDGLTGTSWSLPVSAFGAHATAYVQLTAKRDGLESLQGLMIYVGIDTPVAGYGFQYGEDYGGAGGSGSAISIPSDTGVDFNETLWIAENASQPYSTLFDSGTGEFTFEVLDGDRYNGASRADPPNVMRSELYSPGFNAGTNIVFAFTLKVTGTPDPSTNNWLYAGQICSADGITLLAISIDDPISGPGTMTFVLNYEATGLTPTSTTIGSISFARGTSYDISIAFNDSRGAGTGSATVTVGGTVEGSYSGPTGYDTASGDSVCRIGIYTGGNGGDPSAVPLSGQDIIALFTNPSLTS